MPAPDTSSQRSLWLVVAAVALVVAVVAGWWVTRTPRTPTALAAATACHGSDLASPIAWAGATGNRSWRAGDDVVGRLSRQWSPVTRRLPAAALPTWPKRGSASEQAIKLDERYAPAHAGLTLALVRIADAGSRTSRRDSAQGD